MSSPLRHGLALGCLIGLGACARAGLEVPAPVPDAPSSPGAKSSAVDDARDATADTEGMRSAIRDAGDPAAAPSERDASTPSTDGAAADARTADAGGEVDCSDACPTALALGRIHSCALLDDGSVLCAGNNRYGQLDPPEGRVFEQLSAGGFATCGITADGTGVCWGDRALGVDPRRLEDKPLRQLVIGRGFLCALGLDTRVQCWTSEGNRVEQEPTGVVFDVLEAGYAHVCGLSADGAITCWGQTPGDALPPTDGPFTALAAGNGHTCALRGDGSVACWGQDAFGALDPPADARFSQIAAGASHTCGLRLDGSLACWGRDQAGQSDPPGGARFVSVASGEAHSCALELGGRIRCWGIDSFGQLALGR